MPRRSARGSSGRPRCAASLPAQWVPATAQLSRARRPDARPSRRRRRDHRRRVARGLQHRRHRHRPPDRGLGRARARADRRRRLRRARRRPRRRAATNPRSRRSKRRGTAHERAHSDPARLRCAARSRARRQVDVAPRRALLGDGRGHDARCTACWTPPTCARRSRRFARSARTSSLPSRPTARSPAASAGGAARARRMAAASIDCGNSGTTVRLLMGVLAGWPIEVTLTGDESLSRRPDASRHRAARRAWVRRFETAEDGTLPITMHGVARLRRHRLRLAGRVGAGQERGPARRTARQRPHDASPSPRSRRDHTERMLPAFGVPVERRRRSDTPQRSTGPVVLGAPPTRSSFRAIRPRRRS